MLHKLVSLNEKNEQLLSYSEFNRMEDNSDSRKAMKRLLRQAINNELTDKQRFCVCEHYFKNRSMKSIAEELGVNPSTVTRHIQNAQRRLKRVARYYS